MAKAKAKKSGKRKVQVPRPVGGFDVAVAAKRYAQLLADPCNAPLVNSPIGDGRGGNTVRFETDFVIGNGATNTGTAVAWVPNSPGVWVNDVALTTDFTNFAWTTSPNPAPGGAFVTAQATQFRCISGCVQVYWPGSELNRQGIISLSHTGGEIMTLTANTTSALRINATYVARTPAGFAEIVWRPNEYDTLFSEPVAEVATVNQRKKSAIVVTAAGLPVNTGIRIRIVAVYEYIPDITSGMKLAASGAPSGVTLGTVLGMLDRTGDWMYNAAHMGAKALSSLSGGVGGMLSLGNGAYRLGRAMLSR